MYLLNQLSSTRTSRPLIRILSSISIQTRLSTQLSSFTRTQAKSVKNSFAFRSSLQQLSIQQLSEQEPQLIAVSKHSSKCL